jgi:plasmid stability protein
VHDELHSPKKVDSELRIDQIDSAAFTHERATTRNSLEDKSSMRPAVSYIRVSKPKQGRSGLGLEAQQAAIRLFCAQHGYSIEAEYREVETGKGADALDRRAQLAAAMKHARKLGYARDWS